MGLDREERESKHLVRGVLAGVAGGLVASFVMNEFQAALSKGAEIVKEETASPQERAQQQKEKQGQPEPDDATQKTADAIAVAATGDHLSKEQKKTYGPAVHYGFGAAMGGVYGGIAEYACAARAGFGTAFGTLLFIGADEIAVPATGLSQSPAEQPAKAQITPWLAHMVYGASLELVRRLVRKVL